MPALVLDDGSGLSRDNRCTARQLAGVMAFFQLGQLEDLGYIQR